MDFLSHQKMDSHMDEMHEGRWKVCDEDILGEGDEFEETIPMMRVKKYALVTTQKVKTQKSKAGKCIPRLQGGVSCIYLLSNSDWTCFL
jgi:hypothetical protein